RRRLREGARQGGEQCDDDWDLKTASFHRISPLARSGASADHCSLQEKCAARKRRAGRITPLRAKSCFPGGGSYFLSAGFQLLSGLNLAILPASAAVCGPRSFS